MSSHEIDHPNPEVFHSLKNPDMDAGIFRAWVAGPDGFKIQTNNSLFRRSPLDPTQSSKERYNLQTGLTTQDKDLLSDRMTDPIDGEMRFTKGAEALNALRELRSETDPIKREALQLKFENAQKAYIDKNAPKVAIRNITRTTKPGEDLLTFDIKPVSFPVSKNFAKESASEETLNFAESAATALVLITSDNKILITHRSINNEVYPDMIGTSIAGAFDGKFDRDSKEKGKLKPITEEDVLVNIRREAKEELGIDEEYLKKDDISLVGLAEETRPYVHHEFLYLGKTRYTSNEIRNNATKTERARKNNLSVQDIEGKFDFIPATPEAIFTLLTQVVSPIPKTHIANLAVVGYRLCYERDGKDKAMEWKKRVEEGIKANEANINSVVENAYRKNPELLKSTPQRLLSKVESAVKKFMEANPEASEAQIEEYRKKRLSYLPKKDPKGYTYELTPEEQGLIGYNEAMSKSGLISE